MTDTSYIGDELELFAHARRWKRYWQSQLTPLVRGRVLEVGGGIGANTPFFETHATELTVLEPDASKMAVIQAQCRKPHTQVLTATINQVSGTFDAIFYIDVLEHIEDDTAEVALAFKHLAPGGVLVVLAPAHMALYSPFDKTIGHFRRYTKHSLIALCPAQMRVRTAFYLDAIGYLASLANRCLLKQSLPTLAQIKLWDRVMVPLSRVLDPVCGYAVGKTVVAVFEKPVQSHV